MSAASIVFLYDLVALLLRVKHHELPLLSVVIIYSELCLHFVCYALRSDTEYWLLYNICRDAPEKIVLRL